MIPPSYTVVDERPAFVVKKRRTRKGPEEEPAITVLPPEPSMTTEFYRSSSPGVYKAAPTKSATNKAASSFVILGEMLKTPVQSRPGSPSGRVSPFRGHGFKSPAASRAASPDPSKPKPKPAAAKKPIPPPKPKIKTDIGLPPKSPRRAKPRPKNNIVQKTNLGVEKDKGKGKPPNRTPRPTRKPLSTASNKKTDKPPPAEEIIIGETPKQTDMKEVTEALNSLVGESPEVKTEADKTEENASEAETVAEVVDVRPQEEKPKAEEQKEGENEKSDPKPAEDPKPPPPQLEKKESEKLIPCLQPDKCNIAPPTMASPSPIITSAINAPSITPGSAVTKTTESIETAQASTVTTTSLNALSSAVTISGTLARKSQSHKASGPALTAPDPQPPPKEEENTQTAKDTAQSSDLPTAPAAMPPHSQLTVPQAKQESTNSVHGDIISTSDLIKVDSELELLSANNLRDSPPRQPNPAWNDERLVNGDVPGVADNRSKFRRFLSSLWGIIKYLLCCRCVIDRCRRAACCKCNCQRSGQRGCCPRTGPCCERLNVFKNCCGRSNCCKCRKPKCCEGSKCCRGGTKSQTKRKRCAKTNCSCRDCCAKLKNSCSNCGGRVNAFCRALFCLNLICCQKCLRKCCKPCHKLKCCQSGGCCSCFNPSAKRPPKLDKRGSTQSKTDKENQVDPVLVEHVSLMKAAIPVLPTCLAALCLILNLIFPGSGTIMSGVFCLCFGKPRFSVKDTAKNRVGSFCVNLVIGIAQLFTIVFCLVGWGWSIWWGVIMYRLARKQRRIKLAEKSTQEANSANHNHVDVEKG